MRVEDAKAVARNKRNYVSEVVRRVETKTVAPDFRMVRAFSRGANSANSLEVSIGEGGIIEHANSWTLACTKTLVEKAWPRRGVFRRVRKYHQTSCTSVICVLQELAEDARAKSILVEDVS
jgi:hypothetical protein